MVEPVVVPPVLFLVPDLILTVPVKQVTFLVSQLKEVLSKVLVDRLDMLDLMHGQLVVVLRTSVLKVVFLVVPSVT
jgi:hypothetical protein